ncbi:MAG: HPP family protein [Myxococcota bacterium]
MRAEDVMQKDVISVSPHLPLKNFEEFLTEEEISGAPVVGRDGRILGIASKTDVVRALSDQGASSALEQMGLDLTVEDIMTRDLVTVGPQEELTSVARRMIDGHLHRVLVVDGDNVLGIVTTFDLLRAVFE